ncbi:MULTISPECIES: PLP-dependent aminotransferase family protein [unclassified Thalassospira]|uniref:aminotransferase-like domain-containing protein n=1 Tax=unclassified Thalassospira TaxID=2648997 RepID=UPI0007A62F4D|nr:MULTISPECIES: PLP-dependent aminotransferase family protein [unclassified Thalassospira]KZC99903.1 aminotransferase [Thalassospira sp. MCCC 1A02898]ONH85922.1 GntR family transcriptional regulator [Thalassospira sp. MCCC 1A02803]
MSVQWNEMIVADARALRASEIRDLLKVAERPEIISFAGGVPDPKLFPLATFNDVYGDLTGDEQAGRRSLQYSISEGLPGLRQWIADDLAATGAVRDNDNILITCGAQQGLDMLARLLLEPGREIVLEKPSYLGAMQAFSMRRPSYVGIAMDDEGPVIAELDAAFAKGARIAYLSPDFQNPTGRSYSLDRRLAVLETARKYGAVILEDAAYCKLAYEGESLPPLLALDDAHGDPDAGTVIQLGTFSKTLAPALRIGWITAPRPVIKQLVLMKQAGDLHVSTINQEIALRAASKLFPSHLETLQDAYRAKRDVMLGALADFMPEGVNWSRPQGGMFVWLTLPENINSRELLIDAMEDAKVAFVPGQAFFCDQSGINTARLSFATESRERIRDGIERLALLIRRKDNQ